MAGAQSPSKIKPPADCRAAQMYYVMQSMTCGLQQVRRGVLESKKAASPESTEMLPENSNEPVNLSTNGESD